MVILYALLGIIGVGIVGCIFGAISSAKAKKKTLSKTSQELVNDKKTPQEQIHDKKEIFLSKKQLINDKRKLIVEKMDKISNRLIEIGRQVHTILKNYIARYENDKTIDPDFAELLAIYKKRENSVNDEYLSALEKCKNKNLPETKELCKLNDERIRIDEEFDEWNDVCDLKAREKWSNPKCEKMYNELFALENDPIYKEISELYKDIREKEKKWNDFGAGILGECILNGKKGFCRLGRKGDKVAIWSTETYEGKVISIDDVMYFQVDSKTTTSTYTSSSSMGKPSKLGTAANEMLWGTAYATASAMQKNQQSTRTYSNTTKKAKVYFTYESSISPFEVSLDSGVDTLIAMMPEKQR